MKLLVVDDDQAILVALRLLLRRQGYTVVTATSCEQALALASAERFDLFLLDLNYTRDTTSGQEGFSLLSTLRERFPRRPVVVMTSWASIDGAVEAMRRGAVDYVPKPWQNDRLVELLRRYEAADATRGVPDDFEAIADSAPAMRAVLDTIERVAFSDLPVLITGEHGTGKEVVARRIHERSRRSGQFVAVNAGALPDGMIESELFGHVRGAFTDAKTDREGAFAQAAGGTLFLDEIANMPPPHQAKLLRVVQEQQFRPVGGTAPVQSTARVVSATNAALDDDVRRGAFRADLLYRLNTVHIHLPPLRERRQQVPTLAARFVRETAMRYGLAVPAVAPAAMEALCAHDWPGNVRELEHVMQRATLFAVSSGEIDVKSLSLAPAGRSPSAAPAAIDVHAGTSLKEAEGQLIANALARYPNDRLAAARSLGLSRSALYRRIQQLGIKLGR